MSEHGRGSSVAAVARLFGDESRAVICELLLGGEARTASELARAAGIAPSTASGHLRRLTEAGVVIAGDEGRHRLFRLANEEVAEALEALGRIGPERQIRSLRESTEMTALREARTCYDHLAGRLGIELAEALVRTGVLTPDFSVADLRRIAWLGLDLSGASRRPLVRSCLDWTERRPHVGGKLGAALATRLLEVGWIVRRPRSRAVRLTELGRDGMERVSVLGAGGAAGG